MSFAQSISRLWKFHGGLHLDCHKADSTRERVATARLSRQLILPLRQHIGSPAKALVSAGERVRKGQLLAQADGYVSAAVHAPSSGTVTAIEDRPVAHPSGLAAPCLVLETDGLEEWCELPPALSSYLDADPAEVRRRVREAGIVGLGGAVFPSAVKLNPGPNVPIQLLILNGAECEPYITCDDMLMRERACQIIGGLLIMRHALQAGEAIIGIEDNKPEAFEALSAALVESASERIRVQRVATVYPSGGERQLVRILTGKEVPGHAIPAELGIVCHNVGTAAAVYDAVLQGRPLISRYVTVAGAGLRHPRVLEVLIGTPVRDLIEQCGGYTDRVARLIIGGPMMGFALGNDEVPVVKGSNCVLAADADEIAAPRAPMPCIRCGDCVAVCPADLLPQQIYWFARSREFDRARDYHLFDCIECGCCAAVCPSHIPLVQYYRFAKTEIRNRERQRQKADLARRRHEFRAERIEREQDERAARLRQKKEALQRPSSGVVQDSGRTVIEAALARARSRKGAAAPPAGRGPAAGPHRPAAVPDEDSER